jgi:hypothetical protein
MIDVCRFSFVLPTWYLVLIAAKIPSSGNPIPFDLYRQVPLFTPDKKE